MYKVISTRYIFNEVETNPPSLVTSIKQAIFDGSTSKVISLDFEANGLNSNTLLPLIAVLRVNKTTYCFDLLDTVVKKSFTALMRDVITHQLEYKTIYILGHNLKYDLKVLMKIFDDGNQSHLSDYLISTNNLQFLDTMIAHQVIMKGASDSSSLRNLLDVYLNISIEKETRDTFTKIKDSSYIFTQKQYDYAASDVEYLEPLLKTLTKDSDQKLKQYLVNIEFKLIPIIARLEHRGLPFDRSKWEDNFLTAKRELNQIEEQLDNILISLGEVVPDRYKILGNQLDFFYERHPTLRIKSKDAFNYNSSLQLKKLYRKYAGQYTCPTDKDGKFSTGRESLERFVRDHPNTALTPFTNLLLQQRKYSKRISSFGEKFFEYASATNNIHTMYKQSGTATGRFTSGDTKNGFPNMSQIPRSNDYRTAFKVNDGYKGVTIDLAQAELRILASESKDKKMLELINSGDMHSYLATKSMSRLKGTDFIVNKEQNSDIRTKFKNVNFGLIYGATSYRISELLNISLDDAEIVYGVIKEEIPQALAYLETKAQEAIETGKVIFTDKTGTYRMFGNYLDSNYYHSIRREAMNAPIQGINAIMIKHAMVDVDKYLYNNGNRFGNILLQVYDELFIEIKDDEQFEKNVETVENIMRKSCNLYLSNVEMETESNIAYTWIK